VANIDALVLTTVNASWRRDIDAAELVSCLRGEPGRDAWLEHVRTFFEDVPREAIFRFMFTHGIPAERLLATYRDTFDPDERQDDGIGAWLAELADAA
jgi:hypothetical protein